jgi:hydroxymethylpyrimidine/phosphomethylpyrimidine kinase
MGKFCESFSVTTEDLTDLPESAACAAYARYIIDVGTQGDMLDLYVAVASCLIGYGEVGLWLQRQVECGEAVVAGNPYRQWMADYAGKDFLEAVNRGIGEHSSVANIGRWVRDAYPGAIIRL